MRNKGYKEDKHTFAYQKQVNLKHTVLLKKQASAHSKVVVAFHEATQMQHTDYKR